MGLPHASDGEAGELCRTGARHLSGWTDDPLTSVKFDTVLDGKVAIISLSRPKARNAWTGVAHTTKHPHHRHHVNENWQKS